MTAYELNDLIADADGTVWRYGGYDFWYMQTEDQDGALLEDIEGPHTPMVTVYEHVYDEIMEAAEKYWKLCDS